MNRKQRIDRRKSLLKPFGKTEPQPEVKIDYNVKMEIENRENGNFYIFTPSDYPSLTASTPLSSTESEPKSNTLLPSPPTPTPSPPSPPAEQPKKSLLMPSMKVTHQVVAQPQPQHQQYQHQHQHQQYQHQQSKNATEKSTPKHVVRISNINNCEQKCEVIDFLFRSSDFGFTFLHVSDTCKYAFVGLFSGEDAIELRDKFNGLAFNNMVCVAELIVA
jgi:hypothetical protein